MNNIKYMTGLEWDNFKKADERKYILKENKEFLLYYEKIINDKIHLILDIDEMQEMINKIIIFFEFKYPQEMFEDSIMRNANYGLMARRLGIAKLFSKKFNIDQLKYRLHHDMRQFIGCSWGDHLILKKDRRNEWESSQCYIRIDSKGIINEYDAEDLQKFVKSSNIIKNIEELYGKLEGNVTYINYSKVTECIKRHKYETTIRNKVLELIPLQLIYNDPIYGYYRAKSFVRMFNKEYDLDLSLDEVEEILKKDYSKEQKVKTK